MNDLTLLGSFGRVLRVAAAVLALYLLLAPNAHAEPVNAGSLLQNSVLVSGRNSSVYSLDVSGAGVLTVKLENISWPERLAQLDCSIYSKSGLLHSLSGTNEWQFVTTGPASFYASVLAGAGGQLKLGLYSIKVTFQSAASLVPLPAAAWLLGSALGALGLRRAWPRLRFASKRDHSA